jgi:hypothetical protein
MGQAGDFYVEDGCCAACGVPQAVAPDLVGWREDGSRTAAGLSSRRRQRSWIER